MSDVVQVPELVDRDVLDRLIDAYEAAASDGSDMSDQHGNPIVPWSHRQLPSGASRLMLSVAGRCMARTIDAFAIEELYPETVILAVLEAEQGHQSHADNERVVDGVWQPNHTPQRDFTGILYLDDSFDGGDLCFPDRGPLIIKPRRGLYVTFPCNRDFIHLVTPVVSGQRHSMALWYTTTSAWSSPLLRWSMGQAGAAEAAP